MGNLYITPNAKESLDPFDVGRGLMRHVTGDWGDMDRHDQEANRQALFDGGRIFSAFWSVVGCKRFWVITEADRASTTVLMPEDY
jgi:hypothetical protein